MQRLAALDVNGWHDWAARNYAAEDPDESLSQNVRIDGGIASRLVYDMRGLPIAGPQAVLAPHGRGPGWGRIGDEKERRPKTVRTLLAEAVKPPPGHRADPELAALDQALAPGARRLVFAVDDHPGMDPPAQQAIIDRLSGRKRPHCMLLWRPVAALLHALASGLIEAEEGCEIGFLLHDAKGYACQRLRLRRLTEHGGILAPERKDYGRLFASPCGLDALLARLEAEVVAQNPVLADDSQIDRCRLAPSWLLDACENMPVREEILRRGNGSWCRVAVEGPASAHLPAFSPPPKLQDYLAGTAAVLALTPLAPALAADWMASLDDLISAPRIPLPRHAIADGALEAARRIARGIPHYLDWLDPIAMAMLEGREAVFRALFDDASAVVPANREYLSRPQKAVWSSRLNHLEFFIRRGEDGIRKWVTQEREPPSESQQVDIRVRQVPAQGLARVEIVSESWEALRREPIRLDWHTLQNEERSEAEVLRDLSRPMPGKPERLVYEADRQLWDGGRYVGDGLFAAIRHFNADHITAQTRLYHALRMPFKPPGADSRCYAISSDGAPPADVDPGDVARLDAIVDDLACDLVAQSQRGETPEHARGIMATTWVFTRAPGIMKEELLRVLEDETHPWRTLPSWGISMLHSAGRTISDGPMIRQALVATLAMTQNSHTRACQSFLLARRVEAPNVLDRDIRQAITHNTVDALNRQLEIRNFKRDFTYTLYVLAGLLRYREIVPDALLVESSASAQKIAHLLQETLKRLQQPNLDIPARQAKIAVVEELLKYLRGEEGDPRILQAIDSIV
jgi:hypothetical protein